MITERAVVRVPARRWGSLKRTITKCARGWLSDQHAAAMALHQDLLEAGYRKRHFDYKGRYLGWASGQPYPLDRITRALFPVAVTRPSRPAWKDFELPPPGQPLEVAGGTVILDGATHSVIWQIQGDSAQHAFTIDHYRVRQLLGALDELDYGGKNTGGVLIRHAPDGCLPLRRWGPLGEAYELERKW